MNYVADENGYRAELKSTEPGVDEKEPASVIVFKEDTPTLMTYPGPEAASVPDANGNIPGFTAAAASAPMQYTAAAASTPMQYRAVSVPISDTRPEESGKLSANVVVNGQYGGYSFRY